MKYIRTKEGISKMEEDIIEYVIKPNDIQFKQADTIEELCDCYSYDTETVRDVAVARSWKLHNKERKIYGCIKTDKGIIYVAEMKGILPNNEIDWELLCTNKSY